MQARGNSTVVKLEQPAEDGATHIANVESLWDGLIPARSAQHGTCGKPSRGSAAAMRCPKYSERKDERPDAHHCAPLRL
jgi:hypothetical protein